MTIADPFRNLLTRPALFLLACCLLAVTPSRAELVNWYSVEATNLTSTGEPMGADFSFELGVFKSGFVPTADNTTQWAANWVPAQRATYNATLRRFDAQYNVSQDNAPFAIGADAYVWGFRGGTTSSEWILFRNETWAWPAPLGMPPNPNGLYWNTADATAVLGSINESGSPSLMQSAAVTGAASPATTWAQWQASELVGTALNGPNDDPDHDGSSNLMEYVFGTPPKEAGPPSSTTVEVVNDGGSNYLQMTIPRRIDRPAILDVELSTDLIKWDPAGDQISTVSSTPEALVVRYLTPVGPQVPRLFMRVRISLPEP